jgi:hypothetical protein
MRANVPKDGLQCRAFSETSIWHHAINNPIWPFDLSPFLVIETGFVFNDFDWHALCSSVLFLFLFLFNSNHYTFRIGTGFPSEHLTCFRCIFSVLLEC